jgi:hypothetical protein
VIIDWGTGVVSLAKIAVMVTRKAVVKTRILFFMMFCKNSFNF